MTYSQYQQLSRRLIELAPKEVLQIDATIIAGVLIFASLSSLGAPVSAGSWDKAIVYLYTILFMLPFVLSAWETLHGNNAQGVRYLANGFVFIPIVLAALYLLNRFVPLP